MSLGSDGPSSAMKGHSTGLTTSSTIDLHFASDIVPMSRRRAFTAFLYIALFAGGTAASEQSQRPPGPVMMVYFDYYPGTGREFAFWNIG